MALKAYVLTSLSVHPLKDNPIPGSAAIHIPSSAPPRELFGIPCAALAPRGAREAAAQPQGAGAGGSGNRGTQIILGKQPAEPSLAALSHCLLCTAGQMSINYQWK